jgi:hypothetical protein
MGICITLHRLDPAQIDALADDVTSISDSEDANEVLLKAASQNSWDLDKSVYEPCGGLLGIDLSQSSAAGPCSLT